MTEKAQKIITNLRTGCDDAARCKDCAGFKWCHDPNFTLEQVAANLIEELSSELEKVKAERDRYWDWIKAMGCETCSGDCAKCDGVSGWVWSGKYD